jgi:hypothetical protein
MSDSGDDIDLSIFALPKRRGKSSQHPTIEGFRSEQHASARQPTLAREQRRINSDQRRLDDEAARDAERAALIRELTLNGLEAKRQAHVRGDSDAVSSAPLHQPMTVAEAYSLAVSSERRCSPSASAREQDAVLRLWQIVYSLAETGLRSGEDSERLIRAQMTSLCHQAPFYERRLQHRSAINLLERVLVLSKGRRLDSATRTSLVAIYRKLAALYTAIGAVEKAEQRIISAHSLQLQAKRPTRGAGAEAPASALPSDSTALDSSPVAPPPQTAPATHAADSSHVSGAGTLSVDAPAFVGTGNRVDGVTSAATPMPTPSTEWLAAFSPPPASSAAHTAFLDAMRSAMLADSFDGLLRLLNDALLGNKDAQAVIHSPLEGSKITSVMVAAGAGRCEIIRRLLAPLSPQRVIQAILRDVDFAGNSALYHACATDHPDAVDELLRALLRAGAWASTTPSSLEHLSLSSERCSRFSVRVQSLLGSFLKDAVVHCLNVSESPVPFSLPGVSMGAISSQPSHQATWMPHVRLQSPTAAMTTQQRASRVSAAAPITYASAGSASVNGSIRNTAPSAARASVSTHRMLAPQVGRALVPMSLPPVVGGVVDGGLDDDEDPTQWDQFAANAALGVRYSGFNEETYTSALDRGAFSAEQVCVYRSATIIFDALQRSSSAL